jgi:hypothetical protein
VARTYDDEVVVRTTTADPLVDELLATGRTGDGAGRPERPEAFLWRGRLHVVRSVLGRWYERRAWWEQDPQRAEAGVLVGAGSRGPSRTPSLDREVWRVEASAGRVAGSGVYELCREDPAAPGGWSLRRVDD